MTTKYELHLSIGLIHDQEEEIDISDVWDEEEWNGWDDERREKELREYLQEWAANYIEMYYEPLDD